MSLFDSLQQRTAKISVIGLGYVGLPLAVEFAKHYEVVGFDISQEKIAAYKRGIDVTDEVGSEQLLQSTVHFSCDEQDLQTCSFHIVAVPTPIKIDKTPDLAPIISASKTVARNLRKGSMIVYESTVYPGTTEEICLPILEEISGLTFGVDFTLGYSPERINPGDKVHRLTNITKIVSGSDASSLATVAAVYDSIVEAGVYRAESIKVAEAAKIIENSQRDINIALMNEFAVVFNKMGIHTQSVIEAAATKWNFMKFTPGLVGGHCIGVDPYYFIYKAEQLGYHSQIVLSGRMVNDEMGKYVAHQIVKTMMKAGVTGQSLRKPRVAVLGLTFKENCADIRNTKVVDVIQELLDYNLDVLVYDPIAAPDEVYHEYGLKMVDEAALIDLDVVVLAVAHQVFRHQFSLERLETLYAGEAKVLVDIKSTLNKNECLERGYTYWSL